MESRPDNSRRPFPRYWIVAALAPPMLLAWLVWRFVPDVPLVDEWSLIYDLEHHQQGTWTLADMFRSHNGHRLVVPRWLMIGLARASGWDTRLPIAVSLLAMLACGVALARALRPALAEAPPTLRGSALLGASIALFSAAQFENWLWGFMISATLAASALVGVAVLLSEQFTTRRVVLAGGLALVATLSNALGLLAWPIGAFLLFTDRDRRVRKGPAVAWSAVSLAIVVAYQTLHLPLDANPPSDLYLLENPARYAYFVLTFIGAPVTAFAGSAWPPRDLGLGFVAGLIALAVGLLLAFRWRRRIFELEPWERVLLATMAIGIGGAILTGFARGAGGGPAAFGSRYGVWATPLWIGLGVACVRLATRAPHPSVRLVALTGALGIAAGASLSSLDHLPEFRGRALALARPVRALLNAGPESYLAYLQPQTSQISAGRPYLMEHRLSTFRTRPPETSAPPTRLPSWDGFVESVTVPPTFRDRIPVAVAVVARNPTGAPWPTLGRDPDQNGAVRLGSRWFQGGALVREGPRADFPTDVPPRSDAGLDLCLQPPPPGHYRLEIGLLQEGEAWFSDQTAPAWTTEVEVRPAPARLLTRLFQRVRLGVTGVGCG